MKIGIIGFGHLGRALAKGLLSAGICAAADIAVCEATADLARAATSEYGVYASAQVGEVMAHSEYLFLTVKKPALQALAPQMCAVGLNDRLIVSFMAGVPLAFLTHLLPNATIVRGMPTISIADAQGVIGYTPTADPTLAALFAALGYAFEVPEADIEKVTVMVSCGVGFAAYVLDAFASAGESLNMERGFSETLISRAFADAMRMGNYRELTAAVATKGGVTEQGILTFAEGDLFALVQNAVQSAYQKADGNAKTALAEILE